MKDYINRLVRCGYSAEKASDLCIGIIVNLSIFDLECFICAMEKINVEEI